jgi:hypothetical protein
MKIKSEQEEAIGKNRKITDINFLIKKNWVGFVYYFNLLNFIIAFSLENFKYNDVY